MDFGKGETDRAGAKTSTKILPPTSKHFSVSKTLNASSIKTVTPPPAQSKIPKRDVCKPSMLKKTSINTTRWNSRPNNPIDQKKSSKSMVSLCPSINTRLHTIPSSRSNINTQLPKSREQTPRSYISEKYSEKHSKPTDRVAAKKNVVAFESMKEKVRSYQTEFMKKWEVVKNDLPPEEGEYKLIGLVKNNDGQLITKGAQKVKIKCALKSLEDIKKDIKHYVHNNINLILESLDQLRHTSTKIGDNTLKGVECLGAIEDVKKKIKLDNSNALESILKQIEGLETCDKSHEPPKNADLEVKFINLLKEIDELRKNLEESQMEITRIKKCDEDKGSSFKKELEEKEKKLFKKQAECDELKKKLDYIDKDGSKEKTALKEMQEKLSAKSMEVEDLKRKLKIYSHSSCNQLAKNQEHEAKIKKLETDLTVALKDIEKRARNEHTIGDQAMKHADEIRLLKGDLTNSKKERDKLDKEIQALKIDIEKYTETNNQLLATKEMAKHSTLENQTLRQTIKELESEIQANESMATISKEINEELRRLKRTDYEKTQKIEALEAELKKVCFLNERLEEKIDMDRKLLKVRCSIIESLQSKENTQKIHLEDLFVEVGEKNNDVQMIKTHPFQLKSELITKTEEFQTLFSTLSTKQLELTRQEHMIKLLQESNERVQTLRVKQESKIGRLEEEVAQLKKTISLYQGAVLPNEALKKNLQMAEDSRDIDINDSRGYYVDERRRKRHIDISVKKYEK